MADERRKGMPRRNKAADVDGTGGGHDGEKGVAIYHRVFSHESFETAAQMIWELMLQMQERCPGAPRHLFLEIEGHRNPAGGFDADMEELQGNFARTMLLPYLTTYRCTLFGGRTVTNPKQRDDISPSLTVLPKP
jgi:hypothetical protein